MGSAIRWNIDLVREYVEKNGNGDLLISEIYLRNNVPMEFLCFRCGCVYTTRWALFINGARCKMCSMKNLWDKSRASKIDVIEKLKKGGFIIIDDFDYVNNLSRVKIQDIDGYKYNVTVDGACISIKKNFSLNRFDINNPFALENINLWLMKNNKKCEVINGYYENFRTKSLNVKCDQNHFYRTSLSILWASNGSGCPICSGRLATSENNFTIIAPELLIEWSYDKNIKKPQEFTKGGHVKVWWVCLKGHNDYLSTISNKIMGKGCPICAREQTESRVAHYMKNYCIEKFGTDDALPEYRLVKNPKTNYYLKNDIYIESLQLHIEIMGKQHYSMCPRFHKNIEDFEYQQYKDQIKREEVKRLNHNYLEIDIRNKMTLEEYEDILNVYIRKILGKEAEIID